ncbi:MAG: hypothetical protein IKE42_02525 [Aquamicrobium sp.]|jgi:hypothetical protein|uniref:hypothetical protein n=1 Tax=Mesorhizobium sp. Pch-S TaxID=2082387 RepID=UPI001013C21C|nr:hypothetical protein [Mesorhizobium sp. Pch-S]MBR2686702.1 hypothetical protein [Aquamicrobium sp.]
MKSMIVAAAAAFMLTGTASAGVPAKLVIAKDSQKATATLVRTKPGASGGGGGPSFCTPFGCKTLGHGWGG